MATASSAFALANQSLAAYFLSCVEHLQYLGK